MYGTLTDPDRVADVVDDFAFRGDAVLVGMHRVEGEYPTLAPGGEVPGRILATDDIDALDAYEGVDRGLYVRVPVPRGGPWEWAGADDAGAVVQTYVGAPSALGAEEEILWPGEGSFEERVRRVAADCEVRRR